MQMNIDKDFIRVDPCASVASFCFVFFFRRCIPAALKCRGSRHLFEKLFRKKEAPLTGAPQVRRQKTYSAQSGYVYQYYYEGHRPFRRNGEEGTEFVFEVSADRKTSAPVSVFLHDEAVHSWEQRHERPLTSTERYA